MVSVQQQAWRAMLEIFFRQRGRMLAVAQEFGLAPQQAFAVKHLDPERGTPMSELAKLLHCDNSNVTGIADRLEAAGLAERRPHPHDRRVKTLLLTPKGAAVRAAYEERLGAAPPEFDALSDEDADALVAILTRASDAVSAPR